MITVRDRLAAALARYVFPRDLSDMPHDAMADAILDAIDERLAEAIGAKVLAEPSRHVPPVATGAPAVGAPAWPGERVTMYWYGPHWPKSFCPSSRPADGVKTFDYVRADVAEREAEELREWYAVLDAHSAEGAAMLMLERDAARSEAAELRAKVDRLADAQAIAMRLEVAKRAALAAALRPFAEYAAGLPPPVDGANRITDRGYALTSYFDGREYKMTFTELRQAKATMDALDPAARALLDEMAELREQCSRLESELAVRDVAGRALFDRIAELEAAIIAMRGRGPAITAPADVQAEAPKVERIGCEHAGCPDLAPDHAGGRHYCARHLAAVHDGTLFARPPKTADAGPDTRVDQKKGNAS